MTRHSILLSAVAVGALMSSPALAATHKHAHPAKTVESESTAKTAALKTEVDELKAELAALREEIRATKDATAATKTEVAVVATKADTATQVATTAATKADAASAQAEAVKTAEAKTEKSVGQMAWAGDTKVGANVFYNYSTITQKSNGVSQPATGTGFNIKRVYLSVDHKFNDVWSANITTDASNVIGETANSNYYNGATGNAGQTATNIVGKGFYVKLAYVQAKISPALIIRAGSADTAWIPFLQGINGHRYVENELLDEYKLGNSADWGVHALGDLADGHISYQFGVVNGSGYRTVNVTKSVDFDGRISANYAGFFGAVGGYSGRIGKDVEGVNLTHRAERIDLAAGFRNTLFTIGGEYVYAKNFSSVTAATEDKNEGFSAFAHYNITPKWQIFGRYDWIKQTPNTTTGFSVHNEYFNAGLQWEPVKMFDLSLVYKRDSATNFGTANGLIATQNGNIGGTINGTYDEVGLFGQFKF